MFAQVGTESIGVFVGLGVEDCYMRRSSSFWPLSLLAYSLHLSGCSLVPVVTGVGETVEML